MSPLIHLSPCPTSEHVLNPRSSPIKHHPAFPELPDWILLSESSGLGPASGFDASSSAL